MCLNARSGSLKIMPSVHSASSSRADTDHLMVVFPAAFLLTLTRTVCLLTMTPFLFQILPDRPSDQQWILNVLQMSQKELNGINDWAVNMWDFPTLTANPELFFRGVLQCFSNTEVSCFRWDSSNSPTDLNLSFQVLFRGASPLS